MMRFGELTLGAAAILVAGCAHADSAPQAAGETSATRSEIAVNADVTISKEADGYDFVYKAPFADAGGNFDFSQKDPGYSRINLVFTIADGSVDGIKFKPAGEDAIWIVEKAKVGDGSPTERYSGQVFHSFKVSDDGRQLSLVNENNDSVLYRYALRFDFGSETVADDPDTQNGPPH